MSESLNFATDYLGRGWQPLPVPFGGKNPNFNSWQNFTTSENDLPKHFNGRPQNMGVLLGSKSNGLTDIDLDSPEAIKIADFFLPKTEAVFGRKSKPRSHRLYISDFPKTEKFELGETIVEIRSTGGQTIFPPSVHECGEPVEWHSNEKPERIEAAELRCAVALLASACVISKFWLDGVRHDLSLAISGAFLRNGFSEYETKNFIRAVCFVTNDEETDDRLNSVETTAQSLRENRNVFGLPKLAELTNKKTVELLCKWLRIEKQKQVEKDEQSKSSTNGNKQSSFIFSTLDELLNEPEENQSYVWENILIFGGISICSAKPKVGKSTLARNLAVAVANGTSFLGRSTEKGKVIYLCLEEKRAEITKHFKKMGASGQDILIHTGKTPEDILQALKIAIADFEPILVIIDPLSRVLRVNDFNDYASMARGLEPFIDLAREFNVHILALHHDGKGGREGNDSILGSTAIFGAVDCHINLKKRETGRTVSTTQRYGIDLPETVVELDTETGLILEKGDLQSFILQEKKNEVLGCIGENEQLTESDIKERVGGNSKGIISKAIRALLDENQLFRKGEGKRNQPYLYFKTLANHQTTENEKPIINADKIEARAENQDARFLGFPNSKNPENPENPECENCGLEMILVENNTLWFCQMGCGSRKVKQ